MKTKIIQSCDIRQLQAALQNSGVQSVNVQFNVNQYETKSDLPEEIVLLQAVLEKLPEPRINNLILKAMVAVCQMFDTKKEAAKYLGMSAETIYEYVSMGKPFNFSCRGGQKPKLLEE